MKIVFTYISYILIVGLFLYSKLLPYKDKLYKKYENIFNFFYSLFNPIIDLMKRVIKPLQIGKGLYVDMTQVILLIFFLIIINTFK